jgi:hypothetical protein
MDVFDPLCPNSTILACHRAFISVRSTGVAAPLT